MHSLLEDYLKEVAGHLAGLPSARRTEELREVRTHLENAIIVGREMGRTEEAAAREGLVQFGTPGVLGENLVQAWRREQMLNRRSLFGAACTTAVLFLVCYFVGSLLAAYSSGHPISQAQATARQWTYLVYSGLVIPVSAGIASAVFFSKRAVLGAVIGATVFQCMWWGYLTFRMSTIPHSVRLSKGFFVGEAYLTAESIILTLCVAWAVNRLRTAGQRRRYQEAK